MCMRELLVHARRVYVGQWVCNMLVPISIYAPLVCIYAPLVTLEEVTLSQRLAGAEEKHRNLPFPT